MNNKDVVLYACASRSKEKAEKFAKKHGFSVFYGSYEELFGDKNVDLIYIATPHSTHFEYAKRAIEAGKNVIVEKPITTDSKKLSELKELAENNGVFITEAFWTAFDPLVIGLKKRIESGEFGKIIEINSSFCQPIFFVKRIKEPALAGGALLDLGVYDLFHSLYFSGALPERIEAEAVKTKTGVDATTTVKLFFKDHTAKFVCSINRFDKNDVKIETENATIFLNSINFPTKIVIKHKGTNEKEVSKIPCISGYEFEFLSVAEHLKNGEKQAKEMPLSFSEKIISCCDEIRKQIDLIYPFD